MSSGTSETSKQPEKDRKLFLGGLNYNTTEEGLRSYFSKYGELVDVVVMRFPDTKRSRGFGFVTFADVRQTEDCFNARPHNVDNTNIETKRATPKEEMSKDEEGTQPEVMRKLFVGGLDYATDNEGLRQHFEQFGELVDCVVMKFRDTKRSRGFGFVTYAHSDMVDACQAARPHEVDGTKVETKRATPREEMGKESASLSASSIKRIFVGGLKEGISDEDVENYFSKFGNVVKVEQMTEKDSGMKRGFGFVEFDDYDPVDKVVLISKHQINNWKIDVKKAISKTEMKTRNRNRDHTPHRRGEPAPWGNSGGGGGGGGMGGGGGGGGFGFGGFGGWSGNHSGGLDEPPSPWAGSNSRGGDSWENQGGWGGGATNNGVWGSNFSNFSNRGGSNGMGGGGGGGGGPMRNSNISNRHAPYSMGGRDSGGGYTRGGGGGGGGGRW